MRVLPLGRICGGDRCARTAGHTVSPVFTPGCRNTECMCNAKLHYTQAHSLEFDRVKRSLNIKAFKMKTASCSFVFRLILITSMISADVIRDEIAGSQKRFLAYQTESRPENSKRSEFCSDF